MSRHHFGHRANANDFVNATWPVSQKEVDMMFPKDSLGVEKPFEYSNLRNNRRNILDEDEVFGDRTVVIKAVPRSYTRPPGFIGTTD